MDSRLATKEAELRFLFEEYKRNPSLFKKETVIEDADFLSKVGIHIPDKNNFIRGYLKLYPQDFIVEEVGRDDCLETINLDNEDYAYAESNPEGQTVYATLVKCNIPSIEVVKDLSRMLGCDVSQIQYAGIKDKEAITSQRISFRGVNIEDIRKLKSEFFFLKNIFIGKGVIQRGFLNGNRFTLFIRTGEDRNNSEKIEIFSQKLKEVIEKGFYNFFYTQRFGSPRFINFKWATLILQDKYLDAIWGFLSDTAPSEVLYYKKFRDDIREHKGNWKKIEEILSPFPINFQNELKVVRYLKENPLDFKGALNQIPDQVSLWLYSFSSYYFNQLLSKLIKNKAFIPPTLPLALSLKKEDMIFYKDELTGLGLYPLNLQKIKQDFPFFNLSQGNISTTERVDIYKIEATSQGVAMCFSLKKGDYATTFLSHFFNLMSHYPPNDISKERIDSERVLGIGDYEKVYDYFSEVNISKTKDFFDDFKKELE